MSDKHSPSGARRFPRWPAWGLALLAVVVAAVYFWPGRGGAPAGGPFGGPGFGPMSVPVRAAAAESGTVDVVFRAVGTVTAYNTVTVRPRVDGQLLELRFRDGQKVEEGDVLAVIDPRPFQAQLDEALGRQLQNRAQLENARSDLRRYELLFKQNSLARQQLDAQAALVRQYEGTQKSDQAAVDQARLQLDYSRVRAPIGGLAGLRRVDQGNIVNASDADGLVVITQTQPISAVFALPQAQAPTVLAEMRAGRELPVHLYDATDQYPLAGGVLESVDNQIDVATGTLRFKARFENQDEALMPNQFVNVRLVARQGLPALTIPAIALQQGSRGGFVYVVEDGKVRIQLVKAGLADGDRVVIEEGLQPGQMVVTEGTDRLREGATVQVAKEGEAAAQRGGPSSASSLVGPGAGEQPASGSGAAAPRGPGR